MASSVLKDYIGRGAETDRPAANTIVRGPGVAAYFYAEDSKKLFALNAAGTGWDHINATGGGGGGGGGGGSSTKVWVPLPQIDAKAVTVAATGTFEGSPSNMAFLYPSDSFYWNNSSGPASLTVDMKAPIALTGLAPIQNVAGEPLGTWQLAGSNDNAAFTDIGASQSWSGAIMNPFVGDNTTAYRYYRLTKVTGSTVNYCYIRWMMART